MDYDKTPLEGIQINIYIYIYILVVTKIYSSEWCNLYY